MECGILYGMVPQENIVRNLQELRVGTLKVCLASVNLTGDKAAIISRAYKKQTAEHLSADEQQDFANRLYFYDYKPHCLGDVDYDYTRFLESLSKIHYFQHNFCTEAKLLRNSLS
jgi:hypothetical protein